MRGVAATVAAMPLAAALAALGAAFLTGLDQRTALPAAAEAYSYGFYLDRYPLFALAIVYGLARILAAAATPGPASVPRRILGAALGLALLLVLSLHPTFGGMILRAGFAVGGMSFLNGLPMSAAYALGAAAAALPFGLVLGFSALAAGRPPRPPVGRLRALGRGAGGVLLRYLALWYALALLGFARSMGLGPWPRRPLDAGDFILSGACLLIAFLPHAALVAARLDPDEAAA